MNEKDDYVIPRFFELDREGEGGHEAVVMGSPGSGKTRILQYLAYLAAKGIDFYGKNREKQAGLWRARRHDRYLEFFSLGIGKLMLPEGAAYSLVKVYPGKGKEPGQRIEVTLEELEEEGIDYGFYSNAQDLVSKLEVGKILCILFPGSSSDPTKVRLEETEFYSDVFEALVNRETDEWVHVSIDEGGDILAPYNTDSYKVNKKFIDSVADFRKREINLEVGCHSYVDLDYRILPKLPYHIYKRGAKRTDGETRKLRQETINNTKVNHAWLTDKTFFDDMIYPDMKPDAKLNYSLQTVSRTFIVEKENF